MKGTGTPTPWKDGISAAIAKEKRARESDDPSAETTVSSNNQHRRSKHQQHQQQHQDQPQLFQHRGENIVSASEYQGYTFPHAANKSLDPPQLDRVNASLLLSANEGGAACFFRDYVATRRPCIIENWPTHHQGVGVVRQPVSSSHYYDRIVQCLLQSEEAATTQIAVEERDSVKDKFGQGRRVTMTVREFFQTKLATQRYYLSTQEAPANNNSTSSTIIDPTMLLSPPPPPPFYGPPCHHLRDAQLLPQLSRLTGNLQLSSCNLWVGCCGSGGTTDAAGGGAANNHTAPTTTTTTSSGLHHDFHDNFYCLLQGRKRFHLFAPTEARGLGIVDATLHSNGLLSYRPTRADGVPLLPANANAKIMSPLPVSTAETSKQEAKRRGIANDEESEDDEEEGSEEVVWGKGFDYQSSDEEEGDAAAATACQGDTEEEEEEEELLDEGDTDDDDNIHNCELPKHFSWIDPTGAQSKESIAQTFPAFAHTTECVVELQPGEILYLPASWFHCVTSMAGESGPSSDLPQSKGANSGGVHMAINHWFHPPDNLQDFDHPYRDREYWEPFNKGAM